MLDNVVSEAKKCGIAKIKGYYYPTAKNAMVKELFGAFGFTKVSDTDGNTVWELETSSFEPRTKHIEINTEEK
ncbi:MAG: HAD family hydrolase, partial [Oscillospiraceae bacterium]|nr:HAD family hydrolase [Oscillospiraceae bacterium]